MIVSNGWETIAGMDGAGEPLEKKRWRLLRDKASVSVLCFPSMWKA